jgi:hypothetical protein
MKIMERLIQKVERNSWAKEVAIEKAMTDPEHQALWAERVGIVLGNQVELYIAES